MPTFFGPTNIPPLEAFKLGIPIIYPDLDGLRDQVKDAGLLVDLHNPATLSNYLLKLIKDNSFRNKLIVSGYELYKEIESYDRIKILNEILVKFAIKYSTFKKHL